jgi:spore germination protein YaaH
MRIHELIPYDGLDLVIHNEKHGHTLVLTPQGAVFNNEDTLDMTNMSIAFGVLTTSDQWRIATTEEVNQMRTKKNDFMMKLVWTIPEASTTPAFTVINGSKFYHDDDIK